MASFNREVKTIHGLYRKLEMPPGEPLPCSAHTSRQSCLLGLEANPSLRGLELHICPIRVRNKLLVQNFLLKYHRALKCDPTKTNEERQLALAGASAKLNQWSRLVAMETARVDSQRVYDMDYLIPISAPVTILPFPVNTSKKSRVASGHDDIQEPSSKKRRL